ncbi:MAG: 1-acyl-sn-glycerol-3-phosphate acyltransferase [Campylobacterales bacterium]
MKIFVSYLRGLFFALYMLISLPIIIGLMYLFPKNHRTIRRHWAKLTFWLHGIPLTIEGEADTQAQLIIANHASMWDIIALEAIHPADLCWIAKQEITNIPLYGHIMKAPKMISIDREDKKGLLKLLSESKERLDEGRVISIFPEGTRTHKPGVLLPFKPGAAMIANKHKLRVQPVIILGTGELLPAKSIRLTPHPVTIIYLPAFHATEAGEGWLEKLRDEMQQLIANRLM